MVDETEAIFAEELINLYEEGTLDYKGVFTELLELGFSKSKARTMLSTANPINADEEW